MTTTRYEIVKEDRWIVRRDGVRVGSFNTKRDAAAFLRSLREANRG